ncbi:type II toxin-antitoxin system Phd/YefM family antitoxin [Alkalinema pantanalense CENA528]|uniref:type II toxin-antitoxin system Phd/YefM family antitoxin n=1 Tax=Alkalinema pantanalense TaxID=1620705 RepID=UPI003D6F06B7
MSDSSPQYSIAQARDPLAQWVQPVEAGQPIELTRRGKRVAVVLAEDTDDRGVEQKGTFGQALGAFRERLAIADLDIAPDEVFHEVRDRSVGREVGL